MASRARPVIVTMTTAVIRDMLPPAFTTSAVWHGDLIAVTVPVVSLVGYHHLVNLSVNQQQLIVETS